MGCAFRERGIHFALVRRWEVSGDLKKRRRRWEVSGDLKKRRRRWDGFLLGCQ
jgi:hypothetical protein